MPKLDVLPVGITKHSPLGPLFHDESTNEGNLSILDNIFRKQYAIDEDSELYRHRLFLVYGDQKTVDRIRSCKRLRRRATRPYDSLQWALPVAGLFHLKMNYLYMISTCHYGGIGGDPSTLHDAANVWRRKKISKAKSDFFALEELVIHSFEARVAAVYWSLLSNTGLGNFHDDIDRITRLHSPEEFLSLIERIRVVYFHKATRGDQELQNHCLFLQHTVNYLLLKYAIKYADLGLLRRAVDRACVLFAGTNQRKYAIEMLYFQKLLTTSATPALQRAILANSLINLRGHQDSWFETDRMMEFHIGDMKEIFKAKRGSTIHLDYLFQYCSLNSSFFRLLRSEIERIFSVHVNPGHTVKSATYDLTVMAERLVRQGSLAYKNDRTTKFVAPDLVRLGVAELAGETMEKFNSRELRGYGIESEELEESQTGDLLVDFFALEDTG